MTRAWMRGAPQVLAGLIGLVVLGCLPTSAPPPTPRPPGGSPPPARLTPAPGVPGNPEAGRALFGAKGCGGCHTLRGAPGATGLAGTDLTNVALRPTLAGETIPNSPEQMARWLLDPAALKPGTSMPRLGLTELEARDLTAFLYSQPANPAR